MFFPPQISIERSGAVSVRALPVRMMDRVTTCQVRLWPDIHVPSCTRTHIYHTHTRSQTRTDERESLLNVNLQLRKSEANYSPLLTQRQSNGCFL